jgi:hypothetical protein
MNMTQNISNVWQKAAIAGGLWASVEIIVGSFLHNLRIPFSGSILAFFGIILLVAFSRLWPERGIIWRAGLICALMKSISPSAVILGPMTGIFAEALLLQLFVSVFGRNMLGYITGGMFSLLSALFHKVISLLILYGLDIFKIYLNLYYFALKQIRIQQADPWVAILILIGIYVLFGMIAAFLGYHTGNKSVRSSSPGTIRDGLMESSFPGSLTPPARKYSLLYLIIHSAALPLCLYFVNKPGPLYGLLLPAVYCIFILFVYPKHLKRLKKPFFWIQIIIVAILASLFWTYPAGPSAHTPWQGLWIGLQLNFRAILVIFSFTAISVELKNPVIQKYLLNHGFKNVYWSLNVAFSILPFMMDDIARARSFFTHPIATLSTTISKASRWLETFENKNAS